MSIKCICVLGDLQDLAAVYIGWLARRRQIEVLELAENTLGTDWRFAFEAPKRHGYIEIAGLRHGFSEIDGVFVRLNPQPVLPPNVNLPDFEREVFLVERRKALHCFVNSLPCVVANRLYAGRSNGSKPYQMRLLTNAGLAVPNWIASNDSVVVSEFVEAFPHGAIYKACSGLRSRVRRLDDKLTDRLRHGTSPVVVQEYIAGRDVRVHVVNGRSFATEVISSEVDYRFEHEANAYKATTMPAPIEDLCFQVAGNEDLTLAGFDFRVTDDQRWWCLEVNPMPTFLPYEMATGQPIGNAILDALTARDNLIPTTTLGDKR